MPKLKTKQMHFLFNNLSASNLFTSQTLKTFRFRLLLQLIKISNNSLFYFCEGLVYFVDVQTFVIAALDVCFRDPQSHLHCRELKRLTDDFLFRGGGSCLMGFGVESVVPPGITFVCSGISGIGAAIAAQPMDLVKNRMQMTGGLHNYTSSLHCARVILRNEGFYGFYNGLSASLARQLTYTTARLSIYNLLLEQNKKSDFFGKMLMASVAGSIGAFVGNPADVALVRMSIDKSIPIDQRKNYKHVFDVWFRMTKEDGIRSLWKGSLPTIYR